MRIAYIAAGAAGMVCGSCLHDNTLAATLLDMGEDVALVPTYTPLKTDERNVSHPRVFFGGINVFLQQLSPLFRHTPWWMDRLLDHPALLRAVSGRAGSVDPSKLGALTCSMLAGEQGNQHKELRKLARWLVREFKPDVIHLSNSMLLGMAHLLFQKYGKQCGPPIVCSLSGEDAFLERLTPPHYERARQLLRERARDVDAFTAMNDYYADHMAEYLGVDRQRIHVIPHGLKLEGHGTRTQLADGESQVIGFLARVCADKGLHQLVEACEILTERDDVPPFELRVAGYLGPAERAYLADLQRHADHGSLAGKFTYLGELDRAGKIEFLQSLDIFSVPSVFPEAKGLPALEALANAVPVVLPDHGSYSEIVADTGGGLLCDPHAASDLAGKLRTLLRDPNRAQQLGLTGQAAIRDRYHADRMADATRKLYRQLIEKDGDGVLRFQ